MGQLRSNNKHVVHEEDGNIVVINTCGFIDNAKQQSIDTILENVKKKNEGLIDKVFVTGCLSERYKPDLKKEIPDVDEYFGTTEMPSLLKHLGADYKHELIGERLLTTPKNYAYLKISEGCDRPCSFCAIPLMNANENFSFVDSLFEATSGLTTTGSTIISDLDIRDRPILLWRAMIQWIGGLGILSLGLILLPFLRVGGTTLTFVSILMIAVFNIYEVIGSF